MDMASTSSDVHSQKLQKERKTKERKATVLNIDQDKIAKRKEFFDPLFD
jgi:hypothetical protein